MRVMLYTGKGGVGKTSVVVATSLRLAQAGYKTIAISTDAAHSLSDSFDIKLGPEPVQIVENLWGQETNMSDALKRYWGTIQKWVAALFAWRGMNEVIADEMAVLPGMEELANLLYIVNYSEGSNYDVIIVDCAPTGETLRLLSLPEILHWWMHRLLPIEKTATALLRPIAKPLLNIPLPGDEVFDSAQHLVVELNKMR